jgi:hypothetical protein
MINISKEKLVDLYQNKFLTAFEIAEIFNIEQQDIINLLKNYDIDQKPTLKKYRLLKRTPPTDEQLQIIIGLLLGNNCTLASSGKRTNYYLILRSKTREHLLYVKKLLGNYINVINQDDKGFWCKTVKLSNLTFFSKLFYCNKKKIIKDELLNYATYLSMAIWFSESANTYKESIRFTTNKFSHDEQLILQKMLKMNFGINSKICGYTRNDIQYYFLSLNKRNSTIFMEKIKPFIIESSET